ncbi:zinc-ribbon domain-containing protein [Streptomyces sp. NPDC052042]|uniref:zinc-ribbon domain-containing protein n=1 Tax=Streptomyces sp. NPDC052042 TaxID=3365683 RepID=UPI0037D6BE30
MSSLRISHPVLARQLVDPALGDVLTAGSGKKPEWRCETDPRHVWTAAVYSRVSGVGCPVCAGKLVIPGVNDLATTHPDLAAQLVDHGLGTRLSAGSKTKAEWRCNADPRHVWTSHAGNRVLGRGCPVCANRLVIQGVNDLATTHPDLAAQLADPSAAGTVCAGSTRKMRWRCAVDPEHTWNARLVDRSKNGTGCPYCSGHRVQPGVNDLATTHPDIAAQLADPGTGRTVSAGSVTKVRWRCQADPRHIWDAQVNNRVTGNLCPVCANQTVQPGVNDLATTHPHIAAMLVDPAAAATVTAGSKQVLHWRCPDNAAHTWPAACYHLTGPNPTGCPRCFGPLPSQAENRLAEAVRRLAAGHRVLTSHRGSLDNGQELDIVVPGLGLAVEFNGLYWHSVEAGRKPGYHAAKSAAARARGLHLLHVWEDDWRDRPDIVVRALAHRLGVTRRLTEVLPDADPRIAETVYARTLSPDTATAQEARAFLGAHHIQGPATLTRTFALRDGQREIRALLGLRSPRNNARMRRAAEDWEIQRYATLGIVPGGFTRLLAHAGRSLRAEGISVRRWISFSSHDVSDGGLYRTSGFTAEAELPPDYRYAGNLTGWRRVPKELFQRRRFREDDSLVWDETWTERTAAQQNGLVRIYDAGKTRWVKTL